MRNDFSDLKPGDEVIVHTFGNNTRVLGKVRKINKRGNLMVETESYTKEFRPNGRVTSGWSMNLIRATPALIMSVLHEVEARQLAMELDRINWATESLTLLRAVTATIRTLKEDDR